VADPYVLLFGDTVGLPRLLRVLDPEVVQAVVRAEIRPKQERELTELGHSHGLPVLVQPRQGSDAYPVFVERVRAIAPRMIVVDSYSMLLPPDVLAIPPLGAVNVHYAPLPRYRGPNPTQWAIINGERETAVTIHLMTDEVDAGDILAQRLVPIAFEDTWVDVHARLDAAAEDLLGDQLPRILTGRVRRRPQDEELATRSKRRSREDGLIDWDSTVVRIHDLVRALVPPLPGAYYLSSGQEVVIDRYLTVGSGPMGRPRTIVSSSPSRLSAGRRSGPASCSSTGRSEAPEWSSARQRSIAARPSRWRSGSWRPNWRSPP
jgi:methionyl-tRNA formyltransferase